MTCYQCRYLNGMNCRAFGFRLELGPDLSHPTGIAQQAQCSHGAFLPRTEEPKKTKSQTPITDGACAVGPDEQAESLLKACSALETENRALRKGLSLVADNLENGACVYTECSIEMLTQNLPNEVKLECRNLRGQIAVLKNKLKAAQDAIAN